MWSAKYLPNPRASSAGRGRGDEVRVTGITGADALTDMRGLLPRRAARDAGANAGLRNCTCLGATMARLPATASACRPCRTRPGGVVLTFASDARFPAER